MDNKNNKRGRDVVNIICWKSKNKTIMTSARENPKVKRELLYRKGIPFRNRLFLKIKMRVRNCIRPELIIDNMLIKGLPIKMVIISTPMNEEEITRAIKLIERESEAVINAYCSLILEAILMYIVEIIRIKVKFKEALLVDNSVKNSAEHSENTPL